MDKKLIGRILWIRLEMLKYFYQQLEYSEDFFDSFDVEFLEQMAAGIFKLEVQAFNKYNDKVKTNEIK